MPERRRTTDAEYKAFKESFLRWKIEMGLGGWTVTFGRKEMPDFAQADVDAENYTAHVDMCRNVPEGCSFDKAEAASTGKHECLHILLGRLSWLAKQRFAREGEISEAEELVVRTLENVL